MVTEDIVQENEDIQLITAKDVNNEINTIQPPPSKHRDLMS